MDITVQYATATLMAMTGALLGMIHDVYRTAQREWRFLRRFSALFDLSFWLFGVVFVFTLLLGVNHGEVRIVIFALLLVGYALYHFIARPLVIASTVFILRFIYHVILWVGQAIYAIFIRPILAVLRGIRLLVRSIDRGLWAMEPIVLWPVVTAGRWLKRWGIHLALLGIKKNASKPYFHEGKMGSCAEKNYKMDPSSGGRK
ncbi:spore cortex biosynthesis protein YabQ [Ferroacidibacillus organovorans]|uniref:Spore cortex biosynthesis protein YabQ n=1 Tax=Ferroacidibacillus organovorans TaxID=1765683 RepID=A0A117SY59_9BACL|nr:spore cortex biosynthesis protein YabQ [Ferroacidibacillus organovorans]KUO96406.1 hypothetical protein ATW55_00735 [Ferroacidibacillus organovorans]